MILMKLIIKSVVFSQIKKLLVKVLIVYICNRWLFKINKFNNWVKLIVEVRNFFYKKVLLSTIKVSFLYKISKHNNKIFFKI